VTTHNACDFWFVLRVKPFKECVVSGQLTEGGFHAFCPCRKVNPVNPRSRRMKPFFPGYIFFQPANEGVDLARTQWLPGTLGVVSFGGDPARVPDSMVKAIRAKLADPQLDQPAFTHGQPVVIKDGLFAGYQGIFDARLSGEQRCRVLLRLLQSHGKAVVLPLQALAPTDRR
jgi:transcriptional antiterminator RfaH